MSCDIANGRLEACKDAISGLLNIYFINYGDLNTLSSSVVFDGDDQITTWYTATQINLYKYELKGANGFEQTIQTSRDNGTTFFDQVLTIQLKKQDAVTHKNVKLLAYGRPRIVVETRDHQFFLAGYDQGCDVTAGTVSSGTAMGDFNGYNLTFTGMEKSPAYFIDCADEAGLKAIFTDGADDAIVITS
jgi:hypothetical protein